jgi:hypothetical protein
MDIKEQALEILRREKGSFLLSKEEYDYFFPQKKVTSVEKKPVVIDPMPEIRQLVKKTLPEVTLTELIPGDASAKKMSELWKQKHLEAHVFVVSFGEAGQFLQNVTKAIDSLLAPAILLDGKQTDWNLAFKAPALKLVLAPPFSSWKTTPLAKFYRENPSHQTYFVNEIPLLLMEPVAAYLKNLDLKRELWKTLSTRLSSST